MKIAPQGLVTDLQLTRRAACCVLLGSGIGNSLAQSNATVRALLVGVSTYSFIPKVSLRGPSNDVELMSSALSSLGVQATNMIRLIEQADGRRLPTRSNILSQLDQLTANSQPGDWIVVYLAGHGAQVPQSLSSLQRHKEPDGLDEIFLPRDTRRWLPSKQIVEGAIRDDDLDERITRARARGIHVWLIVDSCHSGDGHRNSTPQAAAMPSVRRSLDPVTLQIPPETVLRAEKAAYAQDRSERTSLRREMAAPQSASTGELVLYFASPPDEETFEDYLPCPERPTERRYYGRFTYSLAYAMRGWNGQFEELSRRVRDFYAGRFPFPTPWLTQRGKAKLNA